MHLVYESNLFYKKYVPTTPLNLFKSSNTKHGIVLLYLLRTLSEYKEGVDEAAAKKLAAPRALGKSERASDKGWRSGLRRSLLETV